ncbi:hypothetical protein F0160_25870 [Paraburkholderia sp. JPY303]|uniref:hypothetical protein n=1 Tax=Paraburkholderia atlantica TaxID=2654982 RepID=UPI0015927631|nr:hypothetical protein [Paraburkholderia atlantica]NUY33906.1 hypothetical protein [Paraburkholderia atlantica]
MSAAPAVFVDQQNWHRLHGARTGLPKGNDLVYRLDAESSFPTVTLRPTRSLIGHTAARAGVREHVLSFTGGLR